MTRKEIEIIRTMEKNAWTKLKKYDYENAPRHGNVETWLNWDLNDLRHAELLNYWVSLHDLMEELKIESERSEEASYYVNALYDERTHTTEEEPTEEPTEPETTEETTEEEPHEREKLTVCRHCLMAIESREGQQVTRTICTDSENETESRCDWCEETGFDELYEIQ